MYTKDKGNRVTLRLNDAQFEFVRVSAEKMGLSPSEFLRVVINMTMSATQTVEQVAEDAIRENALKEGKRRENEQTHIDDSV